MVKINSAKFTNDHIIPKIDQNDTNLTLLTNINIIDNFKFEICLQTTIRVSYIADNNDIW